MTQLPAQAASLTSRQREILQLVAKGLTNGEIAELLQIAAGTVKVHMAAIYRILEVSNRTEAAFALQSAESAAPDQPRQDRGAIAVLPFVPFSADPEQAYFADGLVEELTTRLSRWRWFPVIARQSAFAYKDRSIDLVEVGKELGASYLVEGSVRKSSDQVRVTAQLIDARHNTHLWAESYDGPLTDLFAIQDQITVAIAGAIHPELLKSEVRQAKHLVPENIDAWQLGMMAHARLDERTEQGCDAAIELARQALAQDEQCLVAAFSLAMACYQQLVFQWGGDPFGSAQGVVDAAAICQRIAPEDAYACIAQATAHMLGGRRDEAIASLQRAVEDNPSSARAFSFLGQLVGMRGDVDEGIELLEKAILLSPHDPSLYTMIASIGVCHFSVGRLTEACYQLHRATELNSDDPLVWSMLTAASAHAGWIEEAQLALAELLRVQPNFSMSGFRMIAASLAPDQVARYEAGLRMAGLDLDAT